ncbi:MAG: hypothetical protein J6B45_03795 [Clostridia bacterium]|nr:hypothetical protein [Clostridia bacterium]
MKSPLITMSAVTGKPSKADIYKYLRGLKENGIEQAMLYPRSGCEIEYLSEDWFNTIGDFIACAEELNMYIWLYDDFNWPSGDAGGRVTAKEKFRLKAIVTKGEGAGEISYKSRHNSGLFGEKFFPNLLSPEAVDYFIETTHEEYYKRFGKYFGTVIKGMFTDEPSIGYCCEENSISYYDGMEKDYQKATGRDFHSDMLSCYESFYYNCTDLISKRFKSAYIEKLANWCRSHGILMTGHFMCDNDPVGAVKHGGDFLGNLSSISLPGIDEICTDVKEKSIFSLLGSIEYARKENGAMAELFALGPCSMSYAKKRLMLYLCAAFKVDHYFLAVSHMDMRGNKFITDFFNNFNTDQPDFEGIRLLAKEAKELAKLSKKDYTPNVYVRFPFEQCAKNITGSFDTKVYHDLLYELTYNQVQWKLINKESPDGIPVIEITKDGNITLDSEPYNIRKIKHEKIVTDQNGDTPYGIFVRKYDDGTFIALNLFAQADTYFVKGKPVWFDENSVITDCKSEQYQKEDINAKYDIRYHNLNMIRTVMLSPDKASIIQCDCDKNVILAIRNDDIACLDGTEIWGEYRDGILSDGMKKLYKMSGDVWIKQGNHTLSCKKDYKYLPSVFLLGDFACSVENNKLYIGNRQSSYTVGEKIYDYGKVELISKVKIPKGAAAIELCGTELYTKVYLDGALIDEKIASPYIFKISSDLWGKTVELKIVQFTNISPIFGNIKYWEENAQDIGWRGTPIPHPQHIGFDKACWCF